MPRQLFQCRICRTVHKSESQALLCEKKGRPSLEFHRDQVFDLPYSERSGVAKILNHKVFLSHGKHIVRYSVDWAGRKTSLTQKSILELVNKKSWIPR